MEKSKVRKITIAAAAVSTIWLGTYAYCSRDSPYDGLPERFLGNQYPVSIEQVDPRIIRLYQDGVVGDEFLGQVLDGKIGPRLLDIELTPEQERDIERYGFTTRD